MTAPAPWLDGFERRDLGPDGGVYDRFAAPKIMLHTTEGGTLDGAERAYAAYPPHIGVDPGRRIRRQYVRLDRHSYALRGSESDDEFVVQIEIVGYAAKIRDLTAAQLQWLGAEVVAPVARAIGCPLTAPKVGFHGDASAWGGRPYLASAESPIRFDRAGFEKFSGVCGHQHAPAPDEHWDPGAIDIRRILDAAQQGDDDMFTDEDRKILRQLKREVLGDGDKYRPLRAPIGETNRAVAALFDIDELAAKIAAKVPAGAAVDPTKVAKAVVAELAADLND